MKGFIDYNQHLELHPEVNQGPVWLTKRRCHMGKSRYIDYLPQLNIMWLFCQQLQTAIQSQMLTHSISNNTTCSISYLQLAFNQNWLLLLSMPQARLDKYLRSRFPTKTDKLQFANDHVLELHLVKSNNIPKLIHTTPTTTTARPLPSIQTSLISTGLSDCDSGTC